MTATYRAPSLVLKAAAEDVLARHVPSPAQAPVEFRATTLVTVCEACDWAEFPCDAARLARQVLGLDPETGSPLVPQAPAPAQPAPRGAPIASSPETWVEDTVESPARLQAGALCRVERCGFMSDGPPHVLTVRVACDHHRARIDAPLCRSHAKVADRLVLDGEVLRLGGGR